MSLIWYQALGLLNEEVDRRLYQILKEMHSIWTPLSDLEKVSHHTF